MKRPRRRELPEDDSRHLPTEMLQEIFLKLPTRDVARCCCVSKHWRGAVKVKDPSFRKLHHAEHSVASSGGGAEALLVTDRSLQPSIYSVTSSQRMCRVTDSMGTSYVTTNVCNGFICFGPAVSPAVLCNPATGETLALPPALAPAPPLRFGEIDRRYLFLLGFSPSTGEYKLFRLSFQDLGDDTGHFLDVCTLGDGRGWREHRDLVPFRQIHGVPPVLVDGKLYLVSGSQKFFGLGEPEGILVVDVASEAHCTYRLPDEYNIAFYQRGRALVDVLELHGRFCLAVNYALVCPERPKVEFWVIPRLGCRLAGNNQGWLNWELRYTFYIDVDHARRKTVAYDWGRQYKDQPRAVWVDEDEMLCYMLGDCLYKYDTRGNSRPDPDGFLAWNLKVQLPTNPWPSRRRWNIYGGYRPSLLSPLDFALPSSQDDEGNAVRLPSAQDDEDNQVHAMLHAVRPYKSKRRPSSNDRTSCEPGRKRFAAEITFNADNGLDYAPTTPRSA